MLLKDSGEHDDCCVHNNQTKGKLCSTGYMLQVSVVIYTAVILSNHFTGATEAQIICSEVARILFHEIELSIMSVSNAANGK